MYFTAEMILLTIAYRKGYLSPRNQPYFRRTKSFRAKMREFEKNGLIRRSKYVHGVYILTNFGEQGARWLIKLDGCLR